jgi:polar amino acid transport system substrate-binding protein
MSRSTLARRCFAALAATAALLAAGCDRLPRDPERTLERVEGRVMRVGVSANPPWTVLGAGAPSGVEARLVEDFATSLGARVVWVRGSESALMRALEHFELDLVVAGLTEDAEWDARVGLTRPYVRTATAVGEPRDAAPTTDLTGKAVAVREGDAAAAALRSKRAKPVPHPDPWAAGGLVAAPNWELLARNYRTTRFTLRRHRHVMAVGPGENRFLMRLERFLKPREGEVEKALIAEGGA